MLNIWALTKENTGRQSMNKLSSLAIADLNDIIQTAWYHEHEVTLWCNWMIETLAEGFLLLLTHWGWVMHIFVSKIIIIGSDDGLLPGGPQAIIWTNAEILSISVKVFIQENALENVVCDVAVILSWPQSVKYIHATRLLPVSYLGYKLSNPIIDQKYSHTTKRIVYFF